MVDQSEGHPFKLQSGEEMRISWNGISETQRRLSREWKKAGKGR